jgi:hypothetical protein
MVPLATQCQTLLMKGSYHQGRRLRRLRDRLAYHPDMDLLESVQWMNRC